MMHCKVNSPRSTYKPFTNFKISRSWCSISSSIIPQNRMKRFLINQKESGVVGTMLASIRQSSVMQLLKNAGFDFVIIDGEHGVFSLTDISELCFAAKLLGITPIVRIPDYSSPAQIFGPLDAGAQGLLLPRIKNASQVQEIVNQMKYPPLGSRGNALTRAYCDFKGGNVVQAMRDANEETMCIVQIETKEAVDSLQDIVKVKGLDALLIGPNDLSISLGVAGDQNHPKVREAIEKTIRACQNAPHPVFPAIHMNDLKLAVQWAGQGMRIVSSNAEAGLLVKAGNEVTTAIKVALGSNAKGS